MDEWKTDFMEQLNDNNEPTKNNLDIEEEITCDTDDITHEEKSNKQQRSRSIQDTEVWD